MTFVYDKINFKLTLCSDSVFLIILFYHTNVYVVSPTKQIVIDDVFHNVCVFNLPKI